jgi:FlaA1/EpsC-like NDP-sugar epimerase/dTDP-4-amino-4,6-dideoxygalactose transaminase
LGLRVLDVFAIGGAWLIAGVAAFDHRADAAALRNLLWFVGIPLVISMIVNQLVGLYGPVWRYASVDEAVRVVVAVAIGTTLSSLVLAAVVNIEDVGVSMLVASPIAALLALVGVGGTRFQSRLYAMERQRTRESSPERQGVRVLIAGAGDSGAALAYELSHCTTDEPVQIIGFVDDDPHLKGRSVRGLPVLGSSSQLDSICEKRRIDRILVTLAESEHRKTVINRALATESQVKVLPPTSERVAGSLLSSLRDLDVTDLLGRPHSPVHSHDVERYLSDSTVVVTGAGGSIGSEIARQVAQYQPKRLVLVDRDETLLHELSLQGLCNAETFLADITLEEQVNRIFENYHPQVVFHAAANKHVPILEQHPTEAVRANILGTWYVAQAAAKHGCAGLVHISTDKAAHPCSVMGATKRVAEQIVFDIGRRYDRPFVAVRFGNVLGSRGSVVPTFLRQILDGGPVTVTSPDMTRYFMTIPEAVSLVLQSGAMASQRKVFLLDMGEPVSILDLARQMIRLAGLRPEHDIPISYIGLRAGERMEERLHDDAEILRPGDHPSISVLEPKITLEWEQLHADVEELSSAVATCDNQAAVRQLVEILHAQGVPCDLAAQEIDLRTAEPEPDVIELPPTEEVPVHRAWSRELAILGGSRAFEHPIPFARPARPSLDRVMRRVEHSYDSGILTNGALVAELEEQSAERLGVPHVVAVSSCTSGLILTLQALVEERPGPVVLPSFTFSATCLAATWNQRRPRFVTSDAANFQVDIESAMAALEGASALIATHVFGAPCDPASVEALGRIARVPVLFDAAHAFGARTGAAPIGGFGDAEVFSLTPTKVLVAAEGGLIATRDDALASRLRIARNYGNPGDYDTWFPGLNARMSELHAALALESLDMLGVTLRRRRQLAAVYRRCLDEVPGISYQAVPITDESTFKDFTITVDEEDFGMSRDRLVEVLAAEGVDTRNYFDPPLHLHRAFDGELACDLSRVEAISRSVTSLPIYPDLHVSTVERIVEILLAAHENADQVSTSVAEAARSDASALHLRR